MARRTWTTEELDYLEKSIGKKRISLIAKHLGRSESSVYGKIGYEGIGDTKTASGKLTANALAAALNVDFHTVKLWMKKHNLPYVTRATRETAKYHLIDIMDFWKWARKNTDKLNFHRIECHILVPEPEWVEQQRKLDYIEKPRRQAAKWDEDQDKRLIELLKAGYKKAEIADRMGRSESAIQRRISRLREARVIPMAKVNLRWSDEETQMLLQLEKAGLCDEEIAYELGREREHIVDRRRRLRKYGQYEGHKQKVSP